MSLIVWKKMKTREEGRHEGEVGMPQLSDLYDFLHSISSIYLPIYVWQQYYV